MPFLNPTMRYRSGFLVDQGLSSGTNFLLFVIVARNTSPREFGAFSIAFLTYVFAVSLSRAVVGDPLLARHSVVQDEWRPGGQREATGSAVALGAIFLIVAAVAGTLVGGDVGASLVVLGCALPGLLLQDVWRYLLFAAARPWRAALVDLGWGVLQIGVVLAVLGGLDASVPLLVAAWGLSAAIAGGAACVVTRTVPNPVRLRQWASWHWDLIPSLTGETLLIRGAHQIGQYLIGIVGGIVALGSVRAAMAILGPLNMLFTASHSMAIPALARLYRSGQPLRARNRLRTMTVIVLIASAVVGCAVVLLPTEVGVLLFNENWAPASVVLLPLALSKASEGVSWSTLAGLRALQAVRHSLSARIVSAFAGASLPAIGALIDGARGAGYGIALAAFVTAIALRIAFVRASRKAVQTDLD